MIIYKWAKTERSLIRMAFNDVLNDILQRGQEEIAKGRQNLEAKYRDMKNKAEDVIDGDYTEVKEEDVGEDNDIIDVEAVDVSESGNVPHVIYVEPAEKKVETTGINSEEVETNPLNDSCDESILNQTQRKPEPDVDMQLPAIKIIEKDTTNKQELALVPDAWQDGWHEQFSGRRQMDEDGMVHYQGVLGKFAYDPSEFQLQVVRVDADEFGNPPTSFPILKYIGKEVDGANIHVPEGLVDGSFMFEGNHDLTSQPKLPSSLESGFGMFKDCKNMQLASSVLPSKLQDGAFMYAGCTNLLRGPMVLPKSLKDSTAMFANDVNLSNTPKMVSGLEYADSMFVNCESLTKKPKFPSTTKVTDFATVGCTGIDDTERERAIKAQEKAAQKFERKQNKKSIGDHLGSALSMCMQVHALHKSGSNMFAAMYGAYMARKAGRFSRDMAGGWKVLYKYDKSNFSQMMMLTSQQNARKKRQRNMERVNENMEIFAATDGVRKMSSKGDRKMYENGARAMAGNYFEKVDKFGYMVSKKQLTAARMDCEELKNNMVLRENAGTLSAKAKTYYAKQTIELVSNQVAYFKGADAELSKRGSQVNDKNASMKGLAKVSVENMRELTQTVHELQNQYHFMNERQLQTMVSLMKDTPYGKSKEFQEFVNNMQTDMVGRYQSVQADRTTQSDIYRRKGEKMSQAQSTEQDSTGSFAQSNENQTQDRAASMDAEYGTKFDQQQDRSDQGLSL